MYIYEIKNSEYETKKVVACDILQALVKYRNYLSEHISGDFSDTAVFHCITSCTYIGKYTEEEEYIK
jgi:hypothetical protein